MYQTLASLAQTFGTVLFMVGFFCVLIYALSPSRRATFERASRAPLNDEDEK
jgi:cytochrome c oxidase cbb3-type subunit 4